jgi:hypothetical protein
MPAYHSFYIDLGVRFDVPLNYMVDKPLGKERLNDLGKGTYGLVCQATN